MDGNEFRCSIFNPTLIYCCKRVSAFLIDEIMLQIGSTNETWLWVVVVDQYNSQANSWSLYLKTQTYDNCRGISYLINMNLWW